MLAGGMVAGKCRKEAGEEEKKKPKKTTRNNPRETLQSFPYYVRSRLVDVGLMKKSPSEEVWVGVGG